MSSGSFQTHGACCVLHIACCVLRAVCCVIRAACCVLRAACCVLCADTCCCVLQRAAPQRDAGVWWAHPLHTRCVGIPWDSLLWSYPTHTLLPQSDAGVWLARLLHARCVSVPWDHLLWPYPNHTLMSRTTTEFGRQEERLWPLLALSTILNKSQPKPLWFMD